MGYLHSFSGWVAAVLEHWHGWVSGGVLAFGLEIVEKVWEWKIPKKAFLLILAVGLLWSVFAAWRDENHNSEELISQKAECYSSYNRCDKGMAVEKTLADSCTSNLVYQQSRNDGQQDVFNKCILALGLKNSPERVRIITRMFRMLGAKWSSGSTSQPSDRSLSIVLAETNKIIQPVRVRLECERPFEIFQISIATASGSPMLLTSNSKRISPAAVDVYMDNTWASSSLLALSIVSIDDPGICQVREQ